MLGWAQRSDGCPQRPPRCVLRGGTAPEPGSQQALASPGKPQPCEHKKRIDFFCGQRGSFGFCCSRGMAVKRPLVGSEGRNGSCSTREKSNVNRLEKKNL